ncbi:MULTISPECIES: hypothetical protein [Pandoraea]|jgi:hypothetical protein|uniref:Uncharacterized protein n=1 Tax=Pandoraea pnomenusa TaxID=93220 RepID=A0A378YJ18_9BURK|nr:MULTISPECIES: hypothetical protein [Pandoraea]ANC43602.1 hypothetical protein A6P55_04410 [Pandoraea pnomenusa]QDH60771.1 hypothetical protein FKQ53_16755 [Pandoraea pnomenusa]SUA76491.1 Uncharacterised protein [Pandoraea pnomenusa]
MTRIEPAPPRSARRRLSRRTLWLGIAAAAALPWFAAWWLIPNDRVEWQCLSTIEFDTRTSDGTRVQVFGTMESNYHRDGKGTARFTGRVRQGDALSVVHRASEFEYFALRNWLRVKTLRASRLPNDDTPDDVAYRFVYRGFQPGHTDYFQAMRVGDGASVGYNDQPRVYCAPAPNAGRAR